VTTEYAGAGDPKRSMELLWGLTERPRRGPKPKLTVERIVEVAIALADAEGVPALSMRRVADQLGVTAMSLYTYVPSKAELIDLMLDTVYGEPARPERVEGGWRARLELIARETWALHLRHPWVLQVAQSRPLLGPNLLAKYEYELVAVDGIGLSELEMEFVVTLVNDYVHGAVRAAVIAAQAEQRTGMSDEQWWAAYEPLLIQVYDPDRYPVASRVGPVTGEELGAGDPGRAFEFGLQRVLDGIEALLSGRTPY
jgi:AcrR family transcriptional regulator